MFDRSLLPAVPLEFVVLADSHLMLESSAGSDEFPSRRRQTARGEHALALIAALVAEREGTTVVHLGDLVQEFPGGPNFDRAVDAARAQLARSGLAPRLVAGNHDVGDKPDPTSPADWVTPEYLAAYHRRFGWSWYSWNEVGWHFVVVNSQILNAALADAEEQARWLQRDLETHADQRTFLFLHLAPFLVEPNEPDLGHYDNVADPARGWLLDLCRRYRIDAVFAAHSHYLFVNQIGPTRLLVTPSVSFTRPGFGEVFSSPPPDERGRNDVGKLGFFLVRADDRGPRIHFIRTGGASSPVDSTTPDRILLTRVSRDLPASPLGIVARHPIAAVGEVPIAWPSVVRQPVRNDFPWFALLELGARHVRVPLTDLDDHTQRDRLALLRDEGVQITATHLWSERHDLPARLAPHRERVDVLEVQLAGERLPTLKCLEQVRQCAVGVGVPVALATVLAREVVAGKQHPRTRIGYHPGELSELDRWLSQHDVGVARAVVRADSNRPPLEEMLEAAQQPELTRIGAIDWIVDLVGASERARLNRIAEAIFASALLPNVRLFLDPLIDLDRTMDTVDGLLDRLSNPRPIFHLTRCLNSLLFSSPEPRELAASQTVSGARFFAARGARSTLWLILPEQDGEPFVIDPRGVGLERSDLRAATVYDLARATSRSVDLTNTPTMVWATSGPTLVIATR